MLRKLKYIPLVILAIPAIMFIVLSVKTLTDRQIPYDVKRGDLVLPKFDQVELPFVQKHSDETSLSFTASAAIDVDGDGREELFIGGGYQQENILYQFKGGKFVEIAGVAGITKPVDGTALSALVLDANKDGASDLLISHPEGIWLYTNTKGTFKGEKLNAPMKEDTSPLSIAIADVNNDGSFDMYVSGYVRNDLVEGLNIFNKKGYGGTSALFINDGNNSFKNETEARGLQYLHNTFQASFGDFENDGDLDLIVAHDTGQVRTYVNDGKGFFTNQENPTSKLYSYPMGIGIADINNDGLTDYAFSNIGTTPPTFMVKGDLRDDQPLYRKWIVFQADGKGNFKDIADTVKLAGYEFGWGMSFEDLNLDGREDLLVSQNYVTSPLHKVPFLRLPGRVLLQTASGEYTEVGDELGIVNRRFSIVPLTADFNADGHPDFVHINIAGKSLAFLSKGKTANGFLKVDLGNGLDAIGARITITLEDDSKVFKPYVSGEGLVSDSSHVIIAGLGAQKANAVKVEYLNGKVAEKTGSFRDQTVAFKATN